MGIAGKVADTIINSQSQHMLIEASLCPQFRSSKSDCALCADSCPVGAIDIGENGAEIKGGCINCGACFSVCPNGAFRIKERDDRIIIRELRSKSGTGVHGTKVFRISCEKGDASSDLTVSCLGRLTEVLLLWPIRAGAQAVEIAQPACKDCPSVKAVSHLSDIIRRTLYLYEMLGIERDRIYIKEVPQQGSTKSSEKSVSRREFLGALSKNAAAAIPDFENKEDENGEDFRDVIHKRHENPKRALLLESLRDFSHEAGTLNTVYADSKDSILAEVEVTAECTACGVCAAVCPTGAIIQIRTEDHFSLNFRPDLCTNCKVCVTACMHKAVSIKGSVLLNLLLQQKEMRLFEGKKKACSLCRMDFIDKGAGSVICPLCLDRHRRQMAAIENLIK